MDRGATRKDAADEDESDNVEEVMNDAESAVQDVSVDVDTRLEPSLLEEAEK
jgi:hypothetical protein